MNDIPRLGYNDWARDWFELADAPPPRAVYADLIAAYAQPHRAYHNTEHIADCLRQLDTLLAAGCPCEHPNEVAVALWYHDAIYAPLATDNEAKSAEWLDQVALDAGVSIAARDRLRSLVLVTQHANPHRTPDEALLIDIDLSILASEPSRFDGYEHAIRAEYARVPAFIYRAKRRRVLEKFLARERLYVTAAGHARFEIPARANLARSIAALA